MVLRCLGSSRDPAVLQAVLDFSVSDAVRKQDKFMAVAGCGTNAYGAKLSWEWLKSHWDALYDAFYDSSFLLERFIKYTAGSQSSAAAAEEVKAFFAGQTRTVEAVQRAID